MNNYIERFFAKDVRNFTEISIRFGRGFNFIAGPNGCGKTSILALISHCFHERNLNHTRISAASAFWTDLVCNDTMYRVGTDKDFIKSSGYRKAQIHSWRKPPQEQGRQSVGINEAPSIVGDAIPLIIGATRNITYNQIGGMSRELDGDQNRKKFIEHNTSSIHGEHSPNIKQWLINRYFIIDKDWAIEERKNWQHLITSLPKIAPSGSEFSFVKIGKELEPTFSIYGKECYLEELSAGFQAVLLIIANIFEWVESRPDGMKEVSTAKGSVLIDELDLHLHPEWQFTLRNGLESVFPNLQFVVTTHSPHLLASAKPGEVIVMRPAGSSRQFNLAPSGSSYSGWSTDQILSEVMDVRSLDNKDHEHLIQVALRQAEIRSVDGLSSAIQNLEKVCHPSDAIVTVLKARLAAMMASRND